MKKIFQICFLLFIANNAFSQNNTPWPRDFFDFYSKFRTTVIQEDYSAVTEMTCFPFQAFDTTETLGRVPYEKKLRLIGKKTFVKYGLAKYFLTQAGEIASDVPIIVNGLSTQINYLYEDNAQLIKENEYPQSLKKLRADSSEYDPQTNVVSIARIKFAKKKNGWCWSYAYYMRDDKDKW